MLRAMAKVRSVLLAAAVYWAVVFAFAFVLGIVRTLWLAPRLGELAATLCELPLVLTVSWLTAKRVTRGFGVNAPGEALATGLIAFTLLMLAELALARVLAGQSVGQWAAGLTTPAGMLGLAGQVGFALMPWWVRER
ncbi:MAG: hypothetical protein KGZ65_13305 [Sphingomonadales bacterium]|nr:hypothetical protein [Sphingomonadaceae bacterium]MBS3932201.1 hypothetical protein [Sphingomonadales bacterium]